MPDMRARFPCVRPLNCHNRPTRKIPRKQIMKLPETSNFSNI